MDVVHRPRAGAKQLNDPKSMGFAERGEGFRVHARISSHTNIPVNEYSW
jgi:hypothetical protein